MPHSPAPWKIKRDSFGGTSHVFIHCDREGSSERTVACLMQGSDELDTEFKAWARRDEWLENTQLILAAPEMYKMLKDIFDYLNSISEMYKIVAESPSMKNLDEDIQSIVYSIKTNDLKVPFIEEIESMLNNIQNPGDS